MHGYQCFFLCFSEREGKTGANRFDDEVKRGKINKYFYFNLKIYFILESKSVSTFCDYIRVLDVVSNRVGRNRKRF